jgi:hypothetical protein
VAELRARVVFEAVVGGDDVEGELWGQVVGALSGDEIGGVAPMMRVSSVSSVVSLAITAGWRALGSR